MSRRGLLLGLGLGVGLLGCAATPGLETAPPERLERFAAACEERAAAAGEAYSVRGEAGWLLLRSELLHAAQAARPGRETQARTGALEAILAFHAELAQRSIELWLVPVPAKAAIYPEALGTDLAPAPERLDPGDQELLQRLVASGVRVLDLTPVFLAARAEPGPPLYCQSDSHWSPRGLGIAAGAIAARLGTSLAPPASRPELVAEPAEIAILGDLVAPLGEPSPPPERLAIERVLARGPSGLAPLRPDPQGPILLLGDSHNLVFHSGGELHAHAAGLPDALALRLGRPVDLVAVRGAGANAARMSLARRVGGLEGKRVVIWCLSVRELSQGPPWQKIPLPA